MYPQIVPKSITYRSQETQKEVLERTSEKSNIYFGIQLLKPCKSIENKRFFIVFCISTLFKMMANMEWNVIGSWLRTDPKSIEIPSEINFKNDAIFECCLTLIFGRFWSIWGRKMRCPGSPGRAKYLFFFEFVRLGLLLGAFWVSWGPRGGKDDLQNLSRSGLRAPKRRLRRPKNPPTNSWRHWQSTHD